MGIEIKTRVEVLTWNLVVFQWEPHTTSGANPWYD